MKKNKLVFTAISALALFLSACGCSPTEHSESTSTSDTTSETSTTETTSETSTTETTSETSTTDVSSGTSEVTSDSSENSSETTSITSVIPDPALDADREAAINELTEAFNLLDMEDYSRSRWAELVKALNKGIADIKAANSVDAINNAKNVALNAFDAAETMEECRAGTIFDYASGSYEFDKDDEGHLLIQYYGRPGHWCYVGTKNLQMDITTQNIFSLTFRNNKDFDIKVSLKLGDSSYSYEVDTGVTTIAANATKTLTLSIDYPVTNLYFFLDSTEDHDRNGEVAILGTEFSYEEKETNLPETKVIDMGNTTIVKDGAEATYTLESSDEPYLISRVAYLLKANYNGNGNSKRYFGVNLKAGSNSQYGVADSAGHAQDNDTFEYVWFTVEVASSKHLSAGSQINMSVSYCADGLTFEVVSFRLYYSLWPTIVSETVNIDKVIYESEYNGDKQTTLSNKTLTVPYSSFTNKGKPTKMEITFTQANPNTYSKSSIHINGFPITDFGSGTNDLLNTAPIMGKNSSTGGLTIGDLTPVVTTDTMTIYPINDVNLKLDGEISFDCWWSCATSIKVDSITMYTESENTPKAVTDLSAHGVDGAVVLSWSAAQYATSYNVYKDDVLVDNVNSTYATITGLTNGTAYNFDVEAKNSKGVADKVRVVGTPNVDGDYDPFIDGLNTDLENQIGLANMQSLLNSSMTVEGNNARVKAALDSMKAGNATKIVYFGGSITVGENAELKDENNHQKGYAYYSYQWLKEHFDTNNNSTFINSSICGTGSEIGIVRAQKDIYQYNPSLIFIEFAANNSFTELYQQSFESLVRSCLNLSSKPGVIINISATDYTGGKTVEYMENIAKHYGIPVCSMDAGLKAICATDSNNHLTTADPIFNAFISDGTHPNDLGHQLYGKVLANTLRRIANEDADSEVAIPTNPTITGGDKYETITAVDHDLNDSIVTSLGSWTEADTSTSSTSAQSDTTGFRQGWKKTSTTENAALTLNVTCKNFVVIYCANNKASHGAAGTIQVTYTNVNDANDTDTFVWDMNLTYSGGNLNGSTSNGWDNPVGLLLLDNDAANTYTITFEFTEASGTGSLFALGYTD